VNISIKDIPFSDSEVHRSKPYNPLYTLHQRLFDEAQSIIIYTIPASVHDISRIHISYL